MHHLRESEPNKVNVFDSGKEDLDFILKIVKPSKKKLELLDVGCATGFFLRQAATHFKASGVELSDSAAMVAQKRVLM